MVAVNRLVRFALKPASEKRVTVRFFARKALTKLPFAPVRVHLNVAPGEDIYFWWSYVPDVDHADRSLLEYWSDDLGELRFLWQFLKPGMAFFDVGAYHGVFSVIGGLKMSGEGRIVAFEPSPRERRRFDLHCRMNGLTGVRLEPYAVSAASGQAAFFTVKEGFTTMNSLKRPAIDHPLQQLSVDKLSLDQYLERHDIRAVDLMKIDVEGGELEAFLGAKKLLSCVRPLLICEVLDWVTRPWGYEAREIVERLRAQGYEWFDFCEDGTLRPLLLREAYSEFRNYLAVPKEKLTLIERWRNI
jgi:FkbM family methyltransferase